MPPIDAFSGPSALADTQTTAAPASHAAVSMGVRDLRRATALGYAPAFRDQRSGEVHLCLTETGEIAAVHLFETLPDHWLIARSADGDAATLAPWVRPGYYSMGRFIDAADLLAHATRVDYGPN